MVEESQKSHIWLVLLALVLVIVLCAAPASEMMGAILVGSAATQSCGDPQARQLMDPNSAALVDSHLLTQSQQKAATSTEVGQTGNGGFAPQALAYQQGRQSSSQEGVGADPSPSPTEPGTQCGINPNGNAIVGWALAMAAHLYSCPSPVNDYSQMDTCYDKAMPAPVIAYWEKTCSGCAEWQEGNLQCVMTVLAAYGLGGSPAPVVRGNAIGFWLNYSRIAGWVEIPSLFAPGSVQGFAPPNVRGLPLPGDMIVFYISWDPLVGHVGVVVKVTPPTATKAGSVTFAEANGPTPLITMPIESDLTVNVPWAGYYVTGYVRFVGTSPKGTTA